MSGSFVKAWLVYTLVEVSGGFGKYALLGQTPRVAVSGADKEAC